MSSLQPCVAGAKMSYRCLEGTVRHRIVGSAGTEQCPENAIATVKPKCRERLVRVQFGLKAVSCSLTWARRVFVGLGCHLVEEILQQVHFNMEHMRAIHAGAIRQLSLDAWKSILK